MGQLEQKETYQLHAKKLRRNKERTMDGNEALVGKPNTFVFFYVLWSFIKLRKHVTRIRISGGKIYEMLIESHFRNNSPGKI